MATTNTQAIAKRVKGGSFLIEERLPQDIFTPEDFSDEHRQTAKTTVEFTTNEVMPVAAEIEAKNFAVTRSLLRKAGELGLTAVDIPEQYGGMEMDKVTSAIIADSMSQLASFSVAFSAHVGIGTLPIVWYGTAAQKEKYLPKLATGEWIGAYALSESSSASDAMNCRARAVLSADGNPAAGNEAPERQVRHGDDVCGRRHGRRGHFREFELVPFQLLQPTSTSL